MLRILGAVPVSPSKGIKQKQPSLEKSTVGRAPPRPRKRRNFEGGEGLLVVHGGSSSRDVADAVKESSDRGL